MFLNNLFVDRGQKKLFYKWAFCGLLFLMPQINEAYSTEESKPEIFKVGVFLTNIYDISFSKQEFSATFWIWFLHSGKYSNPEKLFEVVNGKELKILHTSHHNVAGGKRLTLAKVTTKAIESWELTDFPFDVHKLKIIIEVLGHSSKSIIYEQDCKNSILLDKTIESSLSGWKVSKYDIPIGVESYPSSFGNPVKENYDSFSTITPTLYIKREWVPEFMRLFSILYFSFLFATLAALLPKHKIGAKANLIAISIATIIVSKFVVDAYLPASGSFSLYSSIESATLWLILLLTLYEILIFIVPKDSLLSRPLFKYSIYGAVLVIYFTVNFVLIYNTYNKYSQAFEDTVQTCPIR